MTVIGAGNGQASVPCPPDHPFVLGGGGQAGNGGSLTASMPLPPAAGPESGQPYGWQVQANGAFPVQVFAICAK